MGEVNISQENLDRFLKVAEKLELDGLLTLENDDFEQRMDEKTFNTETLDDHELTETKSISTKQSKIMMNAGSSSTKQSRVVMFVLVVWLLMAVTWIWSSGCGRKAVRGGK